MGGTAVVVSGALAATLVALGCADPASTPPDATAPQSDAGVVAPPSIEWWSEATGGTPDIAPPALGPCPDGWREVTDDAITFCEPWPEGGRVACGLDGAHFAGEPACTTIGSPCPSGDFAEGLPTDGTAIYVLAGAAAGGDGSRARPFASLSEALVAASAGEVVAIGKGRYDAAVRVPAGVTLRGACVAETLLTASAPSVLDGVVTAASVGGALRDLRIGESARPGVVVRGMGATLEMDGVLVTSAEGMGALVMSGARLIARNIALRDTRARADGTWGRALDVEGASAEVVRAVIERNREVAVFVTNPGTSVRLERVVVEDTDSAASDGRRGVGIEARHGALLELSAVVIEGNRWTGLSASDASTVVRGESVVVRANRERTFDREGGMGVWFSDGAVGEIGRVLADDNRQEAITCIGATLTLEDAVVRNTDGRESDSRGGLGFDVQGGAVVRVTRAVVAHNRLAAILASGGATSISLSDVTVRDTDSQSSDRMFGRGLSVQDGAVAQVARAAFERNREGAVIAAGAGVMLTMDDVVIRGTRSVESTGEFGRGLTVQGGATAIVSRAVLEDNLDDALSAHYEGTRVELEDVVIRDTNSRESDGSYGRAISAELGASVEGARVLLTRAREVGLFAIVGAVVRLVDVEVRDTLERACATSTCADAPFGTGVGAFDGADVSLTRFAVRRAPLCGVQLARDARMDLHDGEVSGALIGACVQVDAYDYARLQDRVSYFDNGSNLQSTSLPVPDGAEQVQMIAP